MTAYLSMSKIETQLQKKEDEEIMKSDDLLFHMTCCMQVNLGQ